jgi:hypothetical protein
VKEQWSFPKKGAEMLNELYQLSKILKEAGIIPYEWHKDLKSLPNAYEKSPCYRLQIDQSGSFVNIEPLKLGTVKSLRKWEQNLGDSFPGFNIQPLYRITDETKKKTLKRWEEGKEQTNVAMLKEWCQNPEAKNWDKKATKKINKCLGSIPWQILERCGSIPADFQAIRMLCERATALGEDSSRMLFRGLDAFVWQSFEKGENFRSLFHILIHQGSPKKKPDNDRGSISVFLDVPDWKKYPVAHEKTIMFINKCLLGRTKESGIKTGNGVKDAFGNGVEGQEEKLPEIKLPALGGVKLRAMFDAIPCQFRYGTIDSMSYRIGEESRRLAKGALEWLKDESREGQTWGRTEGKELLFAYPTMIPETPIKLASILGARRQDDTEARFASYAEDVVKCLEGLSAPLKDIELRVFSLRKMDKARTKVVFHRNYSAQRLAEAAGEWQDGCANIPIIRIKCWGDERGKTSFAEPDVPFPLQISDCLNRVWKMDGTTSGVVKSIPKSGGIELLLEESTATNKSSYLLSVALQNGGGLFLSLGNSLHCGQVISLSGFNKHKQLMPAILGLLLCKMRIKKEVYMGNAPYLVGRMLKLADELHALYCKEVRNGGLPPQLLGNALMVSALDSPTQALSQLALRIAPYLGWARTNSTDSAGLSRYYLKEFGLVGDKLRDLSFPARLDDPAKAQVLLGYISSNSKQEDPTDY